MNEFLALQEFLPVENNSGENCIWCLRPKAKNTAHIFSKKLISSNKRENLLKYSVCHDCNHLCGKTEQWVLRNTPIGWARYFLVKPQSSNSSESTVPAYYYDSKFNEWLVYTIKKNFEIKRFIVPQLILSHKGDFVFHCHGEFSKDVVRNKINILLGMLRSKDYLIDLEKDLPLNFSPRAILVGESCLLIAKDGGEINRFLDRLGGYSFKEELWNKERADSSGKEEQHFKWSNENWIRFSAKIAYEALCLFEGAEFCQKGEFSGVRSFVLKSPSRKYKEILFDENGPMDSTNLKISSCVDLSAGQNFPQFSSMCSVNVQPGMHGVVIYELSGWICASISVLGGYPMLLILAGPNLHLKDIYIMVFDPEGEGFQFLKLAYDKNLDVMPIGVPKGMLSEMVTTYKLRPLEKS